MPCSGKGLRRGERPFRNDSGVCRQQKGAAESRWGGKIWASPKVGERALVLTHIRSSQVKRKASVREKPRKDGTKAWWEGQGGLASSIT